MTLRQALRYAVGAVLLNSGLLVWNAMHGGWWYGTLCLINAVAVGVSVDAVQKLHKLAQKASDGNQ